MGPIPPMASIRFLVLLASSATAITQSRFATHVARQLTNSEGGRIEQTATSLIMPTWPTPEPSTGPLPELEGLDNNITSWAWLWGWHGCSNSQKSAVLDGLKEAHAVLGSDGVYNIDKHWNDYAVVEYLGTPIKLHRENKKNGIRDMDQSVYPFHVNEANDNCARQVQPCLQLSAKLVLLVRHTNILRQRSGRNLHE